jgi:hypothetical protein
MLKFLSGMKWIGWFIYINFIDVEQVNPFTFILEIDHINKRPNEAQQ